MDEKIKRDMILDHYQNPINKEKPNGDGYIVQNSRNASCVDNLDLYLKLDGDEIVDIAFTGEACAISTSATSMMIKKLIGMKKEEAIEVITEFEKMVNEEEYRSDVLTDLLVYDTIHNQPSRKNCALLPFRGIREMLNK